MQRGRELQKVGPLLFSEGECKQILAKTAALSSFQLVLIGLAWKNSECCTCANENANASPRRGTWSACAPALIAAAGAQRHVCGGKRGGLDLAPLRKQRALQNKAWIRHSEMQGAYRSSCNTRSLSVMRPIALPPYAGLLVPLLIYREAWWLFLSGFVSLLSCCLLLKVPVRRKAVPSAAEVLWLSASTQPWFCVQSRCKVSCVLFQSISSVLESELLAWLLLCSKLAVILKHGKTIA